jgi:hypothetical protein
MPAALAGQQLRLHAQHPPQLLLLLLLLLLLGCECGWC